jgi:hypothetical protein
MHIRLSIYTRCCCTFKHAWRCFPLSGRSPISTELAYHRQMRKFGGEAAIEAMPVQTVGLAEQCGVETIALRPSPAAAGRVIA